MNELWRGRVRAVGGADTSRPLSARTHAPTSAPRPAPRPALPPRDQLWQNPWTGVNYDPKLHQVRAWSLVAPALGSLADAPPRRRTSLRRQANRLFSHNACEPTLAVDELQHVVEVLFEGKRVVGPQAFADTYEGYALLPQFDANFFIFGQAHDHYVGEPAAGQRAVLPVLPPLCAPLAHQPADALHAGRQGQDGRAAGAAGRRRSQRPHQVVHVPGVPLKARRVALPPPRRGSR